jgi:hypothetical protein
MHLLGKKNRLYGVGSTRSPSIKQLVGKRPSLVLLLPAWPQFIAHYNWFSSCINIGLSCVNKKSAEGRNCFVAPQINTRRRSEC